MKESLQKINLNIYGVNVLVKCPASIAEWVEHDYRRYLSGDKDKHDLIFNLKIGKPDKTKIVGLIASKYHDDYIVYESGRIRAIDYFSKALVIYINKENKIIISSESKDFAYESFHTAFETLLGEKLDERGFHRIHCLALEKNGKAALLLLPPGAGKTTLALKFLDNKNIKVISEDIALYKKEKIYGLHFRWGVREKTSHKSRVMKRDKHFAKYLIDTQHLNLIKFAEPGIIILGKRWIEDKTLIKKISRERILMPLFKSMVLGLELQQSLAYFLLRNHKEAFSKINIGFSRMIAMLSLAYKSQCYEMLIGSDIERNYRALSNFLGGIEK